MITQSKEKITKADRLLTLITTRREIEKEESELKEYFKHEIKDGVLEAGSVVITIENKSRESLDKKLLEQQMGAEFVKTFMLVTEFQQVDVKLKLVG